MLAYALINNSLDLSNGFLNARRIMGVEIYCAKITVEVLKHLLGFLQLTLELIKSFEHDYHPYELCQNTIINSRASGRAP